MTDKEAQVEALQTYTISKEKVLHRLVKKGIVLQEEADKFSDLTYEELNADDVPGFRITLLGAFAEPLRVADRNCIRERNGDSQLSDSRLASELKHDGLSETVGGKTQSKFFRIYV